MSNDETMTPGEAWSTPRLNELSAALDTAFGDGSATDGSLKDPGDLLDQKI